MADVFISYSSTRRAAARHLEQILIRYGYSVWFDHALVRGADYEAQIQREITAAKAVIVLWCARSVESQAVRSEAHYAKEQGKLIPVRIEPCELPLFSTLTQYIDVTGAACSPRDAALDPVLDDLERLTGQAPAPDFKALRDYEATWRAMAAFTFAGFPLEKAAAPQPVLTLSDAAPAATVSREDADDRLFAEVAAKGTVEDYAFYLKEYPNGRHAGLARYRIKGIKDEQDRAKRAEWRIPLSLREREEGWAEVLRKTVDKTRSPSSSPGSPLIRTNEYRVMVGPKGQEEERWLKPGESIRDLDIAPEMVLVPPGKFWMGSKEGEGNDSERPRHEVAIRYPLLVGKYPVTFAEWDAAVATKGVTHKPNDEGWGRGRRPVIRVSWTDATAYAKWLSGATGKTYRLLSEAEWEYCCRAGTTSVFSFGDTISTNQANYDASYTVESEKEGKTTEVGSFPANDFSLHDMHGNVWEWCADCWNDKYHYYGANDGSAWAPKDCSIHIMRGGSYNNLPALLRSAFRCWGEPTNRRENFGFRLARAFRTRA